MSETQPAQLEKSKSKRKWLLYASVLCSLLAYYTFSLERDSENIDERADVIGEKIQGLSTKLSDLLEEQEQLEKEVSGAEASDNSPEEIRARRVAIKEEAIAIGAEVDTLQAEITELKRSTTSPVQKALTVTAVILIALQLIFMMAYLISRSGTPDSAGINSSVHEEASTN